jgi:nucleotidyltransferase substrate binding protein (TIGR01987 family)
MSVTTNKLPTSSQTNFIRALRNLERSLATPFTEPRDYSGAIKDFEMTYELSWKSLKSLLRSQGHDTQGAKDVFSKAYQLSLIDDDAVWIQMIEDRNMTAHVYDESEARQILDRVRALYLSAFKKLEGLLFPAAVV